MVFTKSETFIRYNTKIRNRLGNLLYGDGCPHCKFNPSARAVAKALSIRESRLGMFIRDERDLERDVLIKMKYLLDSIEFDE